MLHMRGNSLVFDELRDVEDISEGIEPPHYTKYAIDRRNCFGP